MAAILVIATLVLTLASAAFGEDLVKFGAQVTKFDECGYIEVEQVGSSTFKGVGHPAGSLPKKCFLVLNLRGEDLKRAVITIQEKKKMVAAFYHPVSSPWIDMSSSIGLIPAPGQPVVPEPVRGRVLDERMILRVSETCRLECFELWRDEASVVLADATKARAENKRQLTVEEYIQIVRKERESKQAAYLKLQMELAQLKAQQDQIDATKRAARAAEEAAPAAQESAQATDALRSSIDALRLGY